jgi:putative glutamine amidotransferase
MTMSAPLVGISACTKASGALPAQTVSLKYVDAIAQGSEALPLLIPALGAALDVDGLLDRLDGVFLTGSPSNVAPARYGAERTFDASLLDPARDTTTFALIERALARGIPLLAVCRGFQELNVALGGSLHQHVEALPGMRDHRSDDDDPIEVQYGAAHPVVLVPDGLLQGWLGGRTVLQVNSLHSQGIDRLASRLTPEAHADDGLIEAVRVTDAPGFAFAVQWHPEWKVLENPESLAIFRAFGDACRARQQGRSTDISRGIAA